MSNAGKWKIDLRGPYPVWCDIHYGEQHIYTIHHKDLRDLEYAIGRAIKEAASKLGSGNAHEME